MIISEESGGVISNSNKESKFTINASAQAFRILSSGIYEHKIAAIVRELSCNAYDSHVEAGKADVPFTIILPNYLHPYFEIQDYGVGLDDEGVRETYTVYFGSTKTRSNDVVGCLGLGSKTPFSYTDTFTITARKDGVERKYSAYIGEDGSPSVNLMLEIETEKCNGVRITVPVKGSDMPNFKWETNWIASFFKVTPEIKGDHNLHYPGIIEELETRGWVKKITKSGESVLSQLYKNYGNTVYAVMGGVCYEVNYYELLNKFKQKGFEHIFGGGVTFIQFGIGELEVAASRETLSMTERTKENLNAKVEVILDSFIEKEQEVIDEQPNVLLALKYLNSNVGLNAWTTAQFSYKGNKKALVRMWRRGKSMLWQYKASITEPENHYGRVRVKRVATIRPSDFIYSDITDVIYTPPGGSSVGIVSTAKNHLDNDWKRRVLSLIGISKRNVQRVLDFIGCSDANIYKLSDLRVVKPRVKGATGGKTKTPKRTSTQFSAVSYIQGHKKSFQMVDVSDTSYQWLTNGGTGNVGYGINYIPYTEALFYKLMEEHYGKPVRVVVENSRNTKKIAECGLKNAGEAFKEVVETKKGVIGDVYVRSLLSFHGTGYDYLKSMKEEGLQTGDIWNVLDAFQKYSELKTPEWIISASGVANMILSGKEREDLKDIASTMQSRVNTLYTNLFKHYPMMEYARHSYGDKDKERGVEYIRAMQELENYRIQYNAELKAA